MYTWCIAIPRCAQVSISQLRLQAEQYILLQIRGIPDSVGNHGARFRLPRMAGQVPSAGLLDLVRTAYRPEFLREMNPFLSADSRSRILAGIVVWMQLCVLEDRLGRLRRLFGSADDGATHFIAQVCTSLEGHTCLY